MRHHQKYFSVEDADGKLAPQFVAVMNIPAIPKGLVRRGNERVLRARFNDARFFWDVGSEEAAGRSRGRPGQRHLPGEARQLPGKDRAHAALAGRSKLGGDARRRARPRTLCKADLTTEMVKEFTELQGVVGGLYARAQGEPEAVWQAIYDHYKPESMEDAIPRNRTGQIVALADKLDTLRGCFGVGLIPTGSRDPFALRRAAQGVVKILVEGELEFAISTLLRATTALRGLLRGPRPLLLPRNPRLHVRRSQRRAWRPGSATHLVDLEARLERVQRRAADREFRAAGGEFQTHSQHSGTGRSFIEPRRSRRRRCSKPVRERCSLSERIQRLGDCDGQPIAWTMIAACGRRSICFSTRFWSTRRTRRSGRTG